MNRFTTLLLILCAFPMLGQNFLGNPGFEEINKCEEYGASCAPEAWFRIPPYDLTVTDRADRRPHSGRMSELVVIENIYNPLARRIFLYTKILCPLQKGKQYRLSFYLNPLKLEYYKIEALFTEEELIAGVKNPLKFNADIEFTDLNENEAASKRRWKKVEAIYTANGKEEFLTLGNFSKNDVKVSHKQISNTLGDVVILIDDIELTPLDETEGLCDDFEQQKTNVYAQNYRHTNKISINGEPVTMEIPRSMWDDDFFERPLDEKHEETDEITEVDRPIMPEKEWEERDTMVFEIPNVAFDFDKTQIKGEFKERLDLFAQQIEYLNPEKIEFIGHTDSMGAQSIQ